jgi:putative ABC transport system permease protein
MGDRGMDIVLAVVVALMVAVTGVGIVGLASFAVRQRTKQIGTRRALGARRRDIVRYFILENWMITTVGVMVGSVLALGVNAWMVASFELQRLDPLYVPAGILALWLLGLSAVAGPARKAASISPAIATRTI